MLFIISNYIQNSEINIEKIANNKIRNNYLHKIKYG